MVFAVAALLAFSVILRAAHASTYYVSVAGHDKSGDGSKDLPWRGLQRAADRVKPGDHVMISAGSYKPFHIVTDGRSAAPISFTANGPDVHIKGYEFYDDRYVAVSILASYVTLEGFEIDVGLTSPSKSRGIRVSGTDGEHVHGVQVLNNKVANAGWVGITTSYAEGVRIEGNHVWGSRGQHGIYVANSADNPIIRGNILFDNAQAGIQINADPELPGDGIIEGAIVENNILYRNGHRGSAAINLASVRNSRIVGNLLYKNLAQGIASWDDEAGTRYGCMNNLYLNNTVIMPESSRHVMSFRHGSHGNRVYNNILVHLGGKDGLAVDDSSFPGLISDHNVVSMLESTEGRIVTLAQWKEATGLDRASFTSTPEELFSDFSNDRYTLSPSSAAIDAGTARQEVKQDLRGVIRPQGKSLDIGAYEYQGM
jgi:parallel beta-helix repeat protein